MAREVLSHTIQHVGDSLSAPPVLVKIIPITYLQPELPDTFVGVHLQMLDKVLGYRKKYWSVLIGETLVDGGVDLSFYVILLQRNKVGRINNTKWGSHHPY